MRTHFHWQTYRPENLRLNPEQYHQYEYICGGPDEAWPDLLSVYVKAVMESHRGAYAPYDVMAKAVADWVRGTGELTGVDPTPYLPEHRVFQLANEEPQAS